MAWPDIRYTYDIWWYSQFYKSIPMTSYGNYDFLWMQRHSYGCQNSLMLPVTPIPITLSW